MNYLTSSNNLYRIHGVLWTTPWSSRPWSRCTRERRETSMGSDFVRSDFVRNEFAGGEFTFKGVVSSIRAPTGEFSTTFARGQIGRKFDPIGWHRTLLPNTTADDETFYQRKSYEESGSIGNVAESRFWIGNFRPARPVTWSETKGEFKGSVIVPGVFPWPRISSVLDWLRVSEGVRSKRTMGSMLEQSTRESRRGGVEKPGRFFSEHGAPVPGARVEKPWGFFNKHTS